jgi:hypothetical protein
LFAVRVRADSCNLLAVSTISREIPNTGWIMKNVREHVWTYSRRFFLELDFVSLSFDLCGGKAPNSVIEKMNQDTKWRAGSKWN